MIWVIILVLVFVIFYVVSTYNFFVSTKARIKASIQEIGNQLKRQSELIPNLESSAKGYLKHEKGIFDRLADARKTISKAVESGSLQKMADADNKLTGLLTDLKVVVESNPEIKGADVVTKLIDELRDTSDKVMYARRLLIDLSADYNVKRVSLPSSFVASMFNFEEMQGLKTPENEMQVKESEMETPKVNIE